MDGELGNNFFKGFANVLAEMVQEELLKRGIGLVVTSGDPEGNKGEFRASLLSKWPDRAPEMPAREFLYDYVKNWAIEMGIKLARPGVLTTYPMSLPGGVEAAALGIADNLVLRCILDYSVQDNGLIIRVDALAKWDN